MSRSTETLQRRAELVKLARILEREPDDIAYLDPLDLGTLRELREQTIEVLWSANGASLGRLAAASKLLPTALSATIAERAFGPLLTARMAGLLEPARAVDVATRLSIPFLADVAIELDPRRASAVLALIPPAQIHQITEELLDRGEYVTMGRFVGHMQDAAIEAALAAMDNPSLLRVGFVLEDKERLPTLVGLLPEARLEGIIRAAADEQLWLEALDLLSHLDDGLRAEIVARADALDDRALEDVVAAVIEHELWEEVLFIAERDLALQGRLAALMPGLPAGQRQALSRRARAEGVLERLGPLGEALAGSR